jgi:hypothetical protein
MNIKDKKELPPMTYNFPLREGLIVQFFNIPRDLTKEEAKRLSKTIKCLAIK